MCVCVLCIDVERALKTIKNSRGCRNNTVLDDYVGIAFNLKF